MEVRPAHLAEDHHEDGDDLRSRRSPALKLDGQDVDLNSEHLVEHREELVDQEECRPEPRARVEL